MMLAACGSEPLPRQEDGPRLVQEATLAASTTQPTRILSATPEPIIIPLATSELVSPLEVVTIESDVVLITPTLPPSKTPTETPPATATATSTRQPTITATLPPVGVGAMPVLTTVAPINAVPGAGQACAANWFFPPTQTIACPAGAPTSSQSSFQQFQNGFMIWVGSQDSIYVLYISEGQPRWQVYNDNFIEGSPEYDPTYNAPPYVWQPRRGFGNIWRDYPQVRNRLGWTLHEWEIPYTSLLQIAQDSTIYLSDPRGGTFGLYPGGGDWVRIDGPFGLTR